MPLNILETIWELWQAAPFLCSLEVPVLLRTTKPPPDCRDLVALSRAHQYEHFVTNSVKANGKRRQNITVQALQEGPNAVRIGHCSHERIHAHKPDRALVHGWRHVPRLTRKRAGVGGLDVLRGAHCTERTQDEHKLLLEAVKNIVERRHENKVAANDAALSSYISLHPNPAAEPGSLRRIAKISLYVDIALVAKKLSEVRRPCAGHHADTSAHWWAPVSAWALVMSLVARAVAHHVVGAVE